MERVGEWLLAVGDFHTRAETTSQALMWMSPDGGDTWVKVPLDAEMFGRLNGPSSRLLDITGIDDSAGDSDTIKVVVAGYYGDSPALWHGTISP